MIGQSVFSGGDLGSTQLYRLTLRVYRGSGEMKPQFEPHGYEIWSAFYHPQMPGH